MLSRTLTTLAVATLVGAGLGIHLGRAAIGAVDPFYFSDPAGTRSYAELVPAASLSRPWSNDLESAGADYGWPAPCVGCGSDRTVYEPAPYDGFQDAWTPPQDASPRYAVLEQSAVEAEMEAVASGIEEELRRVERYAYYPVSDEAARAHATAISAVRAENVSLDVAEGPEEPREVLLLPEQRVEITRY